jgi:hypothetical protein
MRRLVGFVISLAWGPGITGLLGPASLVPRSNFGISFSVSSLTNCYSGLPNVRGRRLDLDRLYSSRPGGPATLGRGEALLMLQPDLVIERLQPPRVDLPPVSNTPQWMIRIGAYGTRWWSLLLRLLRLLHASDRAARWR